MSCGVLSRSVIWASVGLVWFATGVAEAQGVKPAQVKPNGPPMQVPTGNQAPSKNGSVPAQQAAQEAEPRPRSLPRNPSRARTAGERAGK